MDQLMFIGRMQFLKKLLDEKKYDVVNQQIAFWIHQATIVHKAELEEGYKKYFK